jgi:hypothetical protein
MKYESKKTYPLDKLGIVIFIILFVALVATSASLFEQSLVSSLVNVGIYIFVFIAFRLVFSRKSVIEIKNGAVAYGDGGMVHGNFNTKNVAEIVVHQNKIKPHLKVLTNEGFQYEVNIRGFSDQEIQCIVRDLQTT